VRLTAPTHIGIRYLRDNMRSLIERMDEGEYFVIMRHNHPVGALIPYDALVRLTMSPSSSLWRDDELGRPEADR